jgi:hypothetical protein
MCCVKVVFSFFVNKGGFECLDFDLDLCLFIDGGSELASAASGYKEVLAPAQCLNLSNRHAAFHKSYCSEFIS